MAGNIHDAKMLSAGQIQGRESEFNSDAALFFFFEPIRVNAGQRLYQAGFTVINMSRRPEYDLFHLNALPYIIIHRRDVERAWYLACFLKEKTGQKLNGALLFPTRRFSDEGKIPSSASAAPGDAYLDLRLRRYSEKYANPTMMMASPAMYGI
jgi:hypothetical protein